MYGLLMFAAGTAFMAMCVCINKGNTHGVLFFMMWTVLDIFFAFINKR